MARTVTALLVGIDNYPEPRNRLSGCLNDTTAFAEWLRGRVPVGSLQLKVLRDGEATRENVIGAFREHLGQAGPGDAALFFYAGHGSQERAPEVFWAVEPDHLNETLVMFDSRTPGNWDLADKELATLISEVAAKGPHVVVVLDCCHSGSGTRRVEKGASVRRMELDQRDRPIETFLMEAQKGARLVSRGASGWASSNGRHILMAACRDDQEAKEYDGTGQRRGCFSYFLLEALKAEQSAFTYRDLFKKTQALVRVSVNDQIPQLEATDENDLDRSFLGGELVSHAGTYTASFNPQLNKWEIDGGAIHGVPQPEGKETMRLALFPPNATGEQMKKISDAVGTAEVKVVEAARSFIGIARGTVSPNDTYKALIVSLPLPTCRVLLEGDAASVDLVRAALKGNLYVREAQPATLRVIGSDKEYTIARSSDDRPLTAPIDAVAVGSAAILAARLESIAKWTRIVALDNPNSSIAASEISLAILSGATGDVKLTGPEVRLQYARTLAGAPDPPRFRVRLRNSGKRTLFVALLGLDELFAVKSLFPAGCEKLSPGQEAWAFGGQAVKSVVSQALIDAGATESRDILKLIVSTTSFEPLLMSQPALEAPRTRSASFAKVHGSTLNRLFERVQSRGFEADSGADETIDDFAAHSVAFTTVLPRPAVRVNANTVAMLDGKIEIDPHPSLTADARLSTVSLSRGDLGNSAIPPLFRDTTEDSQLWTLMQTRGSSPELNVLELSNIKDTGAVTREAPLRLRIPIELASGEVVLPYSFEGEFYIPAGRARRDGRRTVVEIQRLTPNGRPLSGSIRILFQKFVNPLLGKPFEYPILSVADLGADDKVIYTKDKEAVRARVKQAARVLVFIHGIIGDTLGMPASVKAPTPHDAVLTFDYENIQTTIEATAQLLSDRLVEAGLGTGHGKELVLIAHSTGGLVARWFIENLGGSQTVSRLIMLGTPNGGSPWATIEDWVTGTAALALNSLTAVSWPAGIVGGLFRVLERTDNSLDEMRPGSEFLTHLAAFSDPGIPYTIIAGNTSLIELPKDGSRVKRLLDKVLRDGTSIAFFFEPNDIAVSVVNINAVNTLRNPVPRLIPVACDHLTYFSSQAGRTALGDLLAAEQSA